MSAIANSLFRSSYSASHIAIEENSTFLKAISCIPMIGIFPSMFQEISLADKINRTADVPRLVELINIKNQYKIANAVRNLLTAALTVTGIALNLFSGFFALAAVLTCLHIGLAAIHIYRVNQNNKVVNELQTTGLRPGMLIT